MTSIADGSVRIQTSSECAASPPSWFGEVVLMAAHLRKQEVLGKIAEHVSFARRRFGRYEEFDFLVFLLYSDLSGNQPLEVLSVTREVARQLALPQTEYLPAPFRRLDDVCAPVYTGRKRGQVVRTRTVISQAHTFQWLGTFGNRGNGRYRTELRQGLSAVGRYLTAHQLPQECALLRLDGQDGTGAVLSDVAGFAFVTRGKDYTVLDHPLVQARLHLPPDQFQQRPESQLVRSLYDCPGVPVGPEGVPCRVVVATHPASTKKSPVGLTREGVVYELFFTKLPQQAFTASDVVELYLHRGAF